MQKKKKMIEERIKELLRNLWTYDKTAWIESHKAWKSINKKDAKIHYYTRIVSIHPKYLFTDKFSSEKLMLE